jgi:hypothetical protein
MKHLVRGCILPVIGGLILACGAEQGTGPELPVAEARGGGGKPEPNEPATNTWDATVTLRDAPADGITSDGRGLYTNREGIVVGYNFAPGSRKEDRIVMIFEGHGRDPRLFRLSIPGVVSMDCGYGLYLASAPDLYDRPDGATVSDGHLKVECATTRRAPRYVVTFDECVAITNTAPAAYVVATDESCMARVELDGLSLGYHAVPHGLGAVLEDVSHGS